MNERLGYAPFAADLLSLLGWLDREESDSLNQIEHVLFCKDYLKYRLTGRVCTDEMEGSVFYDVGDDEYDHGALKALNIDISPEVLPEVVPSWQTSGHGIGTASEATRLPKRVPVASGLHDVRATALGTGAHTLGQAVLIVGTWGQSIVVLNDPWNKGSRADDETSGGLTRRYLNGKYIRYKGLCSAAVCLEWFVREFSRRMAALISSRASTIGCSTSTR